MSDTSPLSTESYKGVRDFYPEDYAKLQALFTGVRTTLASYGYEEYNASPLEHSELYESKGNEEIIREQTFSFVDRGERRVTLRPEMTPTLARMVAAKRRELTFPLRWFSIGNRFRYERPQRGRLREFYQMDVDLVGLPAGEADVEILSLAYDIVRGFGAASSEFSIRVNSRPLLSAAATAAGYTTPDDMREYLRLLDKKDKISHEAYVEGLAGHQDPLALIEEATDETVLQEKKALGALVDAVRARGITNIILDYTVARGFDYYTGMVFEVRDTSPENTRALFGGGRYDGLVALFGGDPVPAVGFALGDVSFADFLETHKHALSTAAMRPQLFIATLSPEDVAPAQMLAHALRAQQVRTFVNLRERSVGDQIKEADKRGIPYCIVYGEQERTSGMVTVKNLASGNGQTVSVADVASVVGA